MANSVGIMTKGTVDMIRRIKHTPPRREEEGGGGGGDLGLAWLLIRQPPGCLGSTTSSLSSSSTCTPMSRLAPAPAS